MKRRRLPIVGSGAGIWSFLHVDDAAAATVAAASRGRGVYNIVDDVPAAFREWLPHLARALGAKPPRHVPAFLARWIIVAGGVAMMTQIRGASNARAKAELGWCPLHPTWRDGFMTLARPAAALGPPTPAPPGRQALAWMGERSDSRGRARDGASLNVRT